MPLIGDGFKRFVNGDRPLPKSTNDHPLPIGLMGRLTDMIRNTPELDAPHISPIEVEALDGCYFRSLQRELNHCSVDLYPHKYYRLVRRSGNSLVNAPLKLQQFNDTHGIWVESGRNGVSLYVEVITEEMFEGQTRPTPQPMYTLDAVDDDDRPDPLDEVLDEGENPLDYP